MPAKLKSDGRLTVLVADDGLEILELVSEQLTDLGHVPYCVSTGQELYYQTKKNSPQVIISDTRMPMVSGGEVGYHGPEVCRRLKKERYCGVIIGTSTGDPVMMQMLWKNIADVYVDKMEISEFLDGLEKVAGKILATRKSR